MLHSQLYKCLYYTPTSLELKHRQSTQLYFVFEDSCAD